MAESIIYLVRHGREATGLRSGGSLTEEGRLEDAPKARDQLLAKGLGSDALVLSSVRLRAVQTAEIIAEGLGTSVITSKRVAEGGTTVNGIRNLDEFLSQALQESDTTRDEGQALVVVTHAPMIALAKGWHHKDAASEIEHGEVVEYQPGTWDNPNFHRGYERLIEDMMED